MPNSLLRFPPVSIVVASIINSQWKDNFNLFFIETFNDSDDTM